MENEKSVWEITFGDIKRSMKAEWKSLTASGVFILDPVDGEWLSFTLKETVFVLQQPGFLLPLHALLRSPELKK